MGGALPPEERGAIGCIARYNGCEGDGEESVSLSVRLRFASVSSEGGERRRMALPLHCIPGEEMPGEEPGEEFSFSDDGLC